MSQPAAYSSIRAFMQNEADPANPGGSSLVEEYGPGSQSFEEETHTTTPATKKFMGMTQGQITLGIVILAAVAIIATSIYNRRKGKRGKR